MGLHSSGAEHWSRKPGVESSNLSGGNFSLTNVHHIFPNVICLFSVPMEKKGVVIVFLYVAENYLKEYEASFSVICSVSWSSACVMDTRVLSSNPY